MFEIEDFNTELAKRVKELASEMAESLIENNPEKYHVDTADYGYYNNGVGMACYGKEEVYDDDKAYEDALEVIATDIANGSYDYETAIKLFMQDEKITSALAKYILTL